MKKACKENGIRLFALFRTGLQRLFNILLGLMGRRVPCGGQFDPPDMTGSKWEIYKCESLHLRGQ